MRTHPLTPHLQARLERIRELVVKKENLILNLTGDRQTLGDALVRSFMLMLMCVYIPICVAVSDRMYATCMCICARVRECVC